MSRIIICDRCGAKIEGTDVTGYVTTNWRSIKSGDLIGLSPDFEEWDVCDDCMSAIEKFVRMKPVPVPAKHSKPIAESLIKDMEPVEVHKEDKPAKASIKKKPKGDIEKIQRLAEDGKTAKEIAELVGCSLPTARKYMKEVISPDEEAEETEAPTV